MARLLVAFADRQLARQIAQGLEAAGLPVFRVCSTANDARRAFNLCDDGVLICQARFPDSTADQLANDLGNRALLLAVGRAEQLGACEHPNVYTLSAPFNMRELIASANMLLQTHYKQLPHRGSDEKTLIDRAKTALMRARGLSEPEAHAWLQKESMRSGESMLRCAQRILQGTGE